MHFVTDYQKILEKVHAINPIDYGSTRNNIDGAVTHLSPYLTHGVISLPLVRDVVLQKYSVKDAYTFIFELAWREFFQRTWENKGDAIFSSLRQSQEGMVHDKGLPVAYLSNATGIQAIDTALLELTRDGCVHNHSRMWLAMLVTVIAKTNWQEGARHLYFHLLDGDRASNTLSWQWVAGTFSSKQYIANQDMINKFSPVAQRNSYLDYPVDTLLDRGIPEELKEHALFELKLDDALLLKKSISLSAFSKKEVWLYSLWTLDPVWKPTASVEVAKILFIDRDDLARFPMSKKRLQCIIDLSQNIEGIQLYYGSLSDITSALSGKEVYKKHHAGSFHLPGEKSSPEYLFPEVADIPNGFMSFWKKCERYL